MVGRASVWECAELAPAFPRAPLASTPFLSHQPLRPQSARGLAHSKTWRNQLLPRPGQATGNNTSKVRRRGGLSHFGLASRHAFRHCGRTGTNGQALTYVL